MPHALRFRGALPRSQACAFRQALETGLRSHAGTCAWSLQARCAAGATRRQADAFPVADRFAPQDPQNWYSCRTMAPHAVHLRLNWRPQ